MKKVAVIGSVGCPAKYGGFETLVEQLVIQLQNKFDITVYCSKQAFEKHPAVIGRTALKYIPLKYLLYTI